MKCKKCGNTMKKEKLESNVYIHVCPNCGNKVGGRR